MSALGRGLQSLIPSRMPRASVAPSEPGLPREAPREVPTGSLRTNPLQPRTTMGRAELEDLVASIRSHGILHPLIVSRAAGGYELIAGERRLQAAKILGLKTVPVIVRDATRQEQLEIALVENLQRKDLNPLEAALAFRRLVDEFTLTQEEVARRVGKSREAVANTLRLLQLPQDIQGLLESGKLTEGHAKILLTAKDAREQRALLGSVLERKLSVHKAAALSRGTRRRRTGPTDPEIIEQESTLQEALGTRVTIARQGKRGTIAIAFYSDEELEALVERLSR